MPILLANKIIRVLDFIVWTTSTSLHTTSTATTFGDGLVQYHFYHLYTSSSYHYLHIIMYVWRQSKFVWRYAPGCQTVEKFCIKLFYWINRVCRNGIVLHLWCEFFLLTTAQLAAIQRKVEWEERDTGLITRNGVTSCVARGYLRSHGPCRQRGTHKGSPPPPHPHLIWDNFQQPP